METDLHRIIYSRQDLSIDHMQYFIYQACDGGGSGGGADIAARAFLRGVVACLSISVRRFCAR